MPIELIIGPSTRSMSRTAAEQSLRQLPTFPEGAEYTIDTHAGHYIAAFQTQAGPFGGGPADAAEEAPAPKSEGPDDAEPSEGGESESRPPGEGEEGGESGPPKEKGEGGEHKEQAEIAHLTLLIQSIADALGVSVDAGLGSPVPGADDPGALGPAGPPVPPHGGLGGPPAPPHGPAGPGGPGGPGGNQHVLHEKAGPPLPPTFASADHPWAHTIGQAQHFRVAEEIGERDVAEMESELQAIAAAGGFQIRRARIETDEDGSRRFAAIIRTPQA